MQNYVEEAGCTYNCSIKFKTTPVNTIFNIFFVVHNGINKIGKNKQNWIQMSKSFFRLHNAQAHQQTTFTSYTYKNERSFPMFYLLLGFHSLHDRKLIFPSEMRTFIVIVCAHFFNGVIGSW